MRARGAMIIAACAAVLAGCGSGGTKTVTVTSTGSVASSPSTTATTSSLPTSSTPAATTLTSESTSTSATTSPPRMTTVHVATFRSPSGNIGCMIIAGTARCDLKTKSWSLPPRPSTCPKVVDFGQGLIVTGSGQGRLVCAGDTTLDPGAKVLPYDTNTVVGAFICESRPDGITCTNTRTTHGFFVSAQSYRVH